MGNLIKSDLINLKEIKKDSELRRMIEEFDYEYENACTYASFRGYKKLNQ